MWETCELLDASEGFSRIDHTHGEFALRLVVSYVRSTSWGMSHVCVCVCVLQLLSSDLALLSAHMTPGKGPGMFPLARHMLTRERAAEILSRPPNLLQTLWYFRRRIQVQSRHILTYRGVQGYGTPLEGGGCIWGSRHILTYAWHSGHLSADT